MQGKNEARKDYERKNGSTRGKKRGSKRKKQGSKDGSIQEKERAKKEARVDQDKKQGRNVTIDERRQEIRKRKKRGLLTTNIR